MGPGDLNGGDDQLEKNRIHTIEVAQDETAHAPSRPVNYKIPLIILASIAAVLVLTVVIVTRFYTKPNIRASKDGPMPFDTIERDMNLQSDNIHIKRGRESHSRGYLNDAVNEFNEVVESDASDSDKAIALTYLGIISDEKGEHDRAIDYYGRAQKYNKLNSDIYKNLSLAYRHKKDFGRAEENARRSISLNDRDIASRILLGNIYYEQGKYDEAAKQYREALDKAPENGALLFNLATALMKRGDEMSAMDYFKRAGAADRIGDVAYRAYGQLGAMYIDRMAFDEAEKYLKMAVSVRPADATNHYNLGIAYLRQNKREEAVAELRKAEELGEQNAALMQNLGEAYVSLKDYDRGLAVFGKLRGMNSRNTKILSRLGEIYYEKGEMDSAYESFKRITELEPTTENARIAYLNMGNILDDTERYEEAIEAYQKALSISPKDDEALYNLGVTYKHAGKPELAIAAWRKASNLDTKDPKPLLAIADYYYEKKLYDLAEKEYRNVAGRWPSSQEAHFKMATIGYKKNQFDYAFRAYEKVIQIDGKSDMARKAYVNQALIIAKNKSDDTSLESAVRMVQKAFMIKPEDTEALFALGVIYSKRGMYDRSIDTFYQVVKSSRDAKFVAEAYNNIGKAYYKKKEFKKALQSFSRGVDEDPSNEEIRINRKTAMQAYERQMDEDR